MQLAFGSMGQFRTTMKVERKIRLHETGVLWAVDVEFANEGKMRASMTTIQRFIHYQVQGQTHLSC